MDPPGPEALRQLRNAMLLGWGSKWRDEECAFKAEIRQTTREGLEVSQGAGRRSLDLSWEALLSLFYVFVIGIRVELVLPCRP